MFSNRIQELNVNIIEKYDTHAVGDTGVVSLGFYSVKRIRVLLHILTLNNSKKFSDFKTLFEVF